MTLALWIVLGVIALYVVIVWFVLALCKTAADADRHLGYKE